MSQGNVTFTGGGFDSSDVGKSINISKGRTPKWWFKPAHWAMTKWNGWMCWLSVEFDVDFFYRATLPCRKFMQTRCYKEIKDADCGTFTITKVKDSTSISYR